MGFTGDAYLIVLDTLGVVRWLHHGGFDSEYRVVTPDALGSPEKPHVLVTGATGYIGGRLVPVFEAAGVRLRCLARQPAALASRVSPTTEIVAGDLLDPASLDRALTSIDLGSTW